MARPVKIVKISEVTKFADSLAKSIRGNLQWSRKLRKAVKVHRVIGSGDELSVVITVGEGNKDLAGMARAFEYGSGLHARNGLARKYKISPVSKRALWFPYPQSKVWKGVKYYKGGITTQMVMHPGVEARPFIGKSITSTLKKSSEELAVGIKRNLVDYLKLELKDLSK